MCSIRDEITDKGRQQWRIIQRFCGGKRKEKKITQRQIKSKTVYKDRGRSWGTQTEETKVIGWGSREIRMKCEIEAWLGQKWDDTKETGEENWYAVHWQHKERHTPPFINNNCILHTSRSWVIPCHMLVPFTYSFTCKPCRGNNLRIICSCYFMCLSLVGAHMAKYCGIQFTYTPEFPSSPSDNIQHNHTHYWAGHSFSGSSVFFWLPSETIWGHSNSLANATRIRTHYAFIGNWKHF